MFVFIPLSPLTRTLHLQQHKYRYRYSAVVASAVVLLPKVLSTLCVQSLRSFKSSPATTATTRSTTVRTTTSPTSYKQARLTHSQQHHTHSQVKAWTYSSPILRTSNKPQPVPMSLSWISSGRFTIVAPATEGTHNAVTYVPPCRYRAPQRHQLC
jgi:hypothetical protein